MSLENLFTKKKSGVKIVLDKVFIVSKKERGMLRVVLNQVEENNIVINESDLKLLQKFKKRLKVN